MTNEKTLISTSAYQYIGTLIILLFISIQTFSQSSITAVNVFTPNNDGINDVFETINKNITFLDCKIYNRWGILVYEMVEPNEVWDGRTSAGIECSPGVYYYTTVAVGEDGQDFNVKGFVELVR